MDTHMGMFVLIVASFWSTSVETVGVGDFIPITEAPYYVGIDDILSGILGKTFCGGSIISEYWIVTAAHCARGLTKYQMNIRTGGSTQKYSGNVHKVEKIIIHPDYENSANELNSRLGHNDIALLKLGRPIVFNSYKQPIEISSKAPKANDTIIILGLGMVGEMLDAESLKRIQMKVKNLTEKEAKLLPTYILATDEYSEACPGDSGGPIVSNNKLIGVLSMGTGCRNWSERLDEKINLITPVHLYYDWIVKYTGIKY